MTQRPAADSSLVRVSVYLAHTGFTVRCQGASVSAIPKQPQHYLFLPVIFPLSGPSPVVPQTSTHQCFNKLSFPAVRIWPARGPLMSRVIIPSPWLLTLNSCCLIGEGLQYWWLITRMFSVHWKYLILQGWEWKRPISW